jgi:hypothetical protein
MLTVRLVRVEKLAWDIVDMFVTVGELVERECCFWWITERKSGAVVEGVTLSL